MAEIRKHNPATDAISRALYKAMGEPVRPVVPGSKQAATAQPADQSRILAVSTDGKGVTFTRRVAKPKTEDKPEGDGDVRPQR